MTERDYFEKTLELSTEFSKHLLAHPELEAGIPEDAAVFFLVDDDPELTRRSIELSNRQKQSGQKVVYVKTKGLRAEPSRLIDPHLQEAVGF